MKVQEIMTKSVECANSDQKVNHAAKMMKSLNVGAVPIKLNDKIVGMVTDRDIVTRLVAEGKDPNKTSLKEIMSKHICCCRQNDSVEDAIRLMEDNKLRRLIVCDEQENPIGILSLGDIAAKGKQEQLAGEALEMIAAH